jgi:hypothetical protein
MFITRVLKLAIDERVVSVEPEPGKLSCPIKEEGLF